MPLLLRLKNYRGKVMEDGIKGPCIVFSADQKIASV